jgi:hypothetical protein
VELERAAQMWSLRRRDLDEQGPAGACVLPQRPPAA